MAGNWTSIIPPSIPVQTPTPIQMSSSSAPPYLSTTAVVGLTPTPLNDDPVAGVLLFFFAGSAVAHAAILGHNRRKREQRKFYFSAMLVALCALRSAALIARVVWASAPDPLTATAPAAAATVMTQTGSVLVFAINIVFALRVLRAYHPAVGWSWGARGVFWFLLAGVLGCLLAIIGATAQSFFTSDVDVRRRDRIVQLVAESYLTALALIPVPVVLLAALLAPRRKCCVEKFGAGRWRTKVALLIFTSLIATLGAGFRVGASFAPRPADSPAWYHGRAAYYCFNYVTDLVISSTYLLARFDRRFVVPDGARGPGDYVPHMGRRFAVSSAPELDDANNTTAATTNKNENDNGNIQGEEKIPAVPAAVVQRNCSGTTTTKRSHSGSTNSTDGQTTLTANPCSNASAYGTDRSSRSASGETTDVEQQLTRPPPPDPEQESAAGTGGFQRMLDTLRPSPSTPAPRGRNRNSIRAALRGRLHLRRSASTPAPTLLPLSRTPPRLELDGLGNGSLTTIDLEWPPRIAAGIVTC
ncbi:hypothetical protein F5B20DRAFT_593787 [Whalleya microplaca]|nr:hypothetical protein F5B20DRAFT_593787 [Whalleya microplaca]